MSPAPSRSEEDRRLAAQLDFNRLTKIARRLISAHVRLALLSDHKKLIWCEDESIGLALGSLGEDPNFSMSAIDRVQRYNFADRALLEVPLKGSQEEPFALLYLYDFSGVLTDATKRADGVDLLANLICHDFDNTQTIERLGNELNHRRDELELVMHIEDNHKTWENREQAIRAHLKEFDEAMEFGMSAVLFTRYDDLPHVQTWNRHSSEETAILDLLKKEVLPWVVHMDRSVMVNHPSDPLQTKISPGLPFKLMITPINDSYGRVVGSLVTLNAYHDRDFTAADQNLQKLIASRIARDYNEEHDPLTGLLNQQGFRKSLTETHQQAVIHQSENTLIRIDVDRMTPLNELGGYEAGDEALQLVASAIQKHIRTDDCSARSHGDIFHCLLKHCSIGEGEIIANRILREVRESQFHIGEQRYPLSISLGATPLGNTPNSISNALSAAEVACEAAKEAGHNRLRVFKQGNVDLLKREQDFDCINAIQRALQDDRFVLFAQRIFPLQSNEPYQHYELLIRMQDENGSIISPGEFIEVAERYQMMPMLDSWILRRSLEMISQVNVPDGMIKPVWNLNISGHTIGDETFQMELQHGLARHGVDPATLCLEIKETSATNHIEKSRDFLESLRERGLLLALDDFGTGVTSFAYLQNIDIDHLKIDGSFIRRLTTDKIAATIVASIQRVARSMNIRTVAEKVEDENAMSCARDLGIDMAQGFFLHRPQPLEEVIEALNAGDHDIAYGQGLAGTGQQNVTEAHLTH